MTRVGSLSTQGVPIFSASLDGPILWNEKQHIFHENPNVVFNLGGLWLPIDQSLLGKFVKFFEP